MRCGFFLASAMAISMMSTGCPQVVFELDDDDAGLSDDDAMADDDTAPADDDDSAASPCADHDWPDLTASLTDACHVPPEPGEYDLVMTMNHPSPSNCSPPRVGRMVDHDGNGTVDEADPMQIWRDAQPHCDSELVDHTGDLLLDFREGYTSEHATIAEVVPYLYGMEYVLLDSDDVLGVYTSAGDTVWAVPFPHDSPGPWMTHLHMGSSLEIVLGVRIVDADDGQLLAVLEGLEDANLGRSVAADLDLDGQQEIMATTYQPDLVTLHSHEGTLIGTCYQEDPGMVGYAIAVGDLDGDPEGEFVVAGTDTLVKCDSDGSHIATMATNLGSPYIIALGELDGDSLPEIVVSDGQHGVFAFDDDMTLLWHFIRHDQTHHPMSLADLNGDGYHEVIVRAFPEVVILDAAGNELAALETDDDTCSSAFGLPAIVDIDADGLAEIVVSGAGSFAIVENDAGGWAVEGADEPWSGRDKFPGDRNALGEVYANNHRHWETPGHNVWNALPSTASADLPLVDLAVDQIDVCADEGSSDALVTVYVGNHGGGGTDGPVDVVLRSSADGSELDRLEVTPDLPGTTARAAQFVIPMDAAGAGFEVIVDEGDAILECDEANNTGVWIGGS